MGTLSGNTADTSVAWAISDSGYVVGSSKAANGETHAFRFTGSTYTLQPWMDLGTLGGNFSEAASVNNLGQVVGVAKNATGQNRAFLWQPGRGMLDLNTKLPGGSGWTLTSVQGINDEGWIVGFGIRGGNTKAWLMKPKLN